MYIAVHGDFDRTMPKDFTDAFIITTIFNTPCSKYVSEAVEITVGNFKPIQNLFIYRWYSYLHRPN